MEVEQLLQLVENYNSDSLMKEIWVSLSDEVRLLHSLLHSNQVILQCNFATAIITMQKANFILQKWKPYFANKLGNTFRSGFFGFGDRSSSSPSTIY